MKEIAELIKTRRCVREYREDPVSDEDIGFLIDCARYAPSGFNEQPWSFLVIKNKEVMEKISEMGKEAMIPLLEPIRSTSRDVKDYLFFLKKKNMNMFYDAPVLIIIFGKKEVPTAGLDCAMAAQNMMLAAHSKGIGSCWIRGVLPALTDEALLKELGAPEGYKAIAPLILGYPKGNGPTPERNEPEVIWLL